MGEKFDCAFCGESTDRADYTLKPPHLEKLMEKRDLRAPIFHYDIPTCANCLRKAEALREEWLEESRNDVSDYLEEIRVDNLIDWNPHTNEPVE